MTLSKFDRCRKICHFLDKNKYVSMGLSSKLNILRVLSCKLKEHNYWLLHHMKEILKISHSYYLLYSIRSEPYYFGIKIKKVVLHCLYRLKTNYIPLIITRVRAQYRYLRYLRDIIGWKLRHSGQYSLTLPAAIATAELFKYGSIKYKQTEKL